MCNVNGYIHHVCTAVHGNRVVMLDACTQGKSL